MKVGKALAIFSFFTILFGSCFNPPEFPIEPQIAFKKLVFRDIIDESKPDSLILYITFKDGDGDLGLDPSDPVHLSAPYNDADYFQTNANGDLIPVPSYIGQLSVSGAAQFIDVLDVENPALGDLVYPRTRKNPAYGSLPAKDKPDGQFNCVNYVYKTFIIPKSDRAITDQYSDISDSLTSNGSVFYMINDSLYFKSNPNHYNIEVDYLVKEGGTFVEFDWRKEFCSTFDGRFPLLSDNDNALDGTLKYNMESRGFKILFGGKTFKLRIQIKDRALHLSNVIETPEVTLESIRI
jgi:hypothetical protein